MKWHRIEAGSWWRPSAHPRRAWHALAVYEGWELCYVYPAEPPFTSLRGWPGIWLPTFAACRRIADAIDEERTR